MGTCVVVGAGAFWVVGVGVGWVVVEGATVSSVLPGKWSPLHPAIKPKINNPLTMPAIVGFIRLSCHHRAWITVDPSITERP